MLLLPSLHDLSLLHLLEGEAPLLGVPGDHDELHTTKTSDSEGRNDAEIGKLEALKLFVDTGKEDDHDDDHNNHLFHLHFLPLWEIDISSLDVIKVSDHLRE